MAGYRKQKLEAQIRRIVGTVLLTDIKDPRIGFVTVTSVKLSRDYSYADIMVSVIGDEKDVRKTMMGLESARKYIQSKVAKNIQTRVLPQVRFHIDTSIREGIEMVGKLEDLEKEGSQEQHTDVAKESDDDGEQRGNA